MSEQTLGQRIAERRKMLSLSQEAFGEKMGVSRQAAFKWESDTSIPEVDKLIHMSRLFGVSVGWLLGEERTEASTEENPNTLLEQFRLTFQTPEDESPLPPEVPAKAAPEPPQETPKPAPKRWMMIAISAITAVSLMVSIFSFAGSRKDLRQLEETNAALQEKVDQYSTQLTDLEDYFISLNQRLDELSGNYHLTVFELNRLQDDFKSLTESLGDGTLLPDNSNPLPKYDNLEVWSLTAQIGKSPSTVDFHFTATASVDIKSATMQVISGDPRKVSSDCIEFACTMSGRDIASEFSLPVYEEYHYQLFLTLSNGHTCYIMLDGHGLENLSELCLPTVRSTPRSVFVFPEKSYFSHGWFNIYLAVPYLAPQDAEYVWSVPKVCYYHNGELVEEETYTVSNAFHDAKKTDASLSFEVHVTSYHMSRFTENDIHELRLEGTLSINGTLTNYSIPLRSWQIRQGEFVSLTE